MTYKKMGIAILSLVLAVMLLTAAVVVIFDPYLHYHAPFEWQSYQLYSVKQRYFNDGILRNFDYDTIITGTSMTENFSASECDELFGAKTVKVPYFGASLKEINDAMLAAVERQPNVKRIIRSMDTYKFFEDKDFMAYDDYPDYLYDDNYFNDVKYLFNKDVLLTDTFYVVISSLRGNEPTSFDEYSNWMSISTFGKDVVLSGYERSAEVKPRLTFTEEDKETVRSNVYQNVISIAEENPDIEFYYFIPPYSAVFWDGLHREGNLERSLECQQLAIEMMLEYDNIKLFSFADDFETVTDLSLYKDTNHYHESVNSKILVSMSEDKHLVTKQNCKAYFESVYSFYTSYDYDSIFE